MNRCEVCRGSKVVRLPLHKEVEVIDFKLDGVPFPTIEPGYKEFPCPECAGKVGDSKILILRSFTEVDTRIAENDKEYMRYVRQSLLSELIYSLENRSDIVRYMKHDNRKTYLTTRFSATLGVVSVNDVQTIEQRVKEKAIEIASMMGSNVIRNIRIWGSTYGRTSIEKDVVCRFVNEAVNEMRK